MAKINISLKLGNEDIVDSDILTDHIALDGLDIDGLRLQGFDNYMIEERRAKVSVQLAGYNERFNKQLIDTITDPENRIKDYFYESDAISVANAYIFSDKTTLDNTKDEELFKRELTMPETMMQNRSDNVLTVQSKVMMDMFLTAMGNMPSGDRWRDDVFNGMGVGDSDSRKVKVAYKKSGVSFNNMLAQILAFLYHGVRLEYPYHNPKTQFKEYLNDIRVDFGGELESMVSGNVSRNLGWIFFMQIRTGFWSSEHRPLEWWIIPAVYSYFLDNNWTIDIPGSDPIQVSEMVFNTEDKKRFVFAAFLASIVKYDWYVSVKDDFFARNMDARLCIDDDFPMGAVPYIPFYRAMEVVRRKNSNRPSDSPYNIFLPWDGEILANRHQVGVLPYRTNHRDFFGRAQRETVGDDNIALNFLNEEDEAMYSDEGLFIPVQRKYKLQYSPFGSIPPNEQPVETVIDTLNYGNIIANIDDNFMCLTHYETTNWMFWDNIRVEETYAPYGGFTDMIPILRDGSGGIIHSHKDAFNKIYKSEHSDLMNICLQIRINNNLIYTGWIDYTTIEISNGRLSFTSTDAIGVLIDNLDKLDEVIFFSQFDKGGELIADKRAGHSIIDFINRMAKDPIPHKPSQWKSVHNLLDAQKHSILNNKVLGDINPRDAVLIALQASQRVLYAKGDGSLALDEVSRDDEMPEEEIIVLDSKHIFEKGLSFGAYTEEFNEEHIVKLAGNQSVLEDIIRFFNRNKSDTQKTLSITTTEDFNKDIKLLDTVEIDGELWTVNEIEYLRM